jgi:hypothetical protein
MQGIHPVFNVSLLQAAPPDPIPGRVHPQPLPVVVESQEEYEVDKILDSRFYRRQLQYLVHWKGYSDRNNTWEPASNLSHAQTEVKKFHRENPNAPQRLAASLFLELPWSTPERLTEMEGKGEDWVLGRRGRRA